jgi:hypothetical protein
MSYLAPPRLTRCRTCSTTSKGYPVPTLSPSIVLAYCVNCRKRGPAQDLGPTEVVEPTRTPDPERATGNGPEEDTEEWVADVEGIPQEDEDHVQAAYREWRGTPDGLAVIAAIRRRAIELRRRGWRRYGIQALAEVVRFDHALTVGPDAAGYKVNNSHLSRLARDLMDEEPELSSFFEVRELRA